MIYKLTIAGTFFLITNIYTDQCRKDGAHGRCLQKKHFMISQMNDLTTLTPCDWEDEGLCDDRVSQSECEDEGLYDDNVTLCERENERCSVMPASKAVEDGGLFADRVTRTSCRQVIFVVSL